MSLYPHSEDTLLLSDQNDNKLLSVTKQPNPPVSDKVKAFVKQKYTPGPWNYALLQVFPVLRLLQPEQRAKYNLFAVWSDFLAGVTLSTVLIPQALSYATLAKLPPQYGLYPACIAPIIYCICGSVREASIGPFALISIVIGNMVSAMHPELETMVDPVEALHFRMVSTMTLTLISGLFSLLFAILKLGWLIDFVSSPAVNGLVMATALSVSASQLGALFGVKLVKSESALDCVISLFAEIANTNFLALIIGILGILFLFGAEIYAQKKKLSVPLPAHITLVIVVTIISAIFNFNKNFGLKVVGDIEMGFLPSVLPSGTVFSNNSVTYITNGFMVAVVCFVISSSVGSMFAELHKYKVNFNSELLSLGLCSIIGAFTNSFTSSASLSRSMVVNATKPKTQLHNLWTAVVMFLVVFLLAPLLWHLPMCVLASVVIGSFRSQFLKYMQGIEFWNQNPREGSVYFCVVFVTLFVSVQGGLVAAFAASLLAVLLQLASFKPIYLVNVPFIQRFVHVDRVVKDVEYYEFLKTIEAQGGLHKITTNNLSGAFRDAANGTTHDTGYTQYQDYEDDNHQQNRDDSNSNPNLPHASISVTDPRVITLQIGQPINFLNQNPVQEFIVRYIDMYEAYIRRTGHYGLNDVENQNTTLLNTVVTPRSDEDIELHSLDDNATRQPSIPSDIANQYLLLSATNLRTNISKPSTLYDLYLESQNAGLLQNNVEHTHTTPTHLEIPHQDDNQYGLDLSLPQNQSPTNSQHKPKNQYRFAATTSVQQQTSKKRYITPLPATRSVPQSVLQDMNTNQHSNVDHPHPTLQPLPSLSNHQYHTLHAMVYDALHLMKDEQLAKYKMVIILDMVTDIDITAKKMIGSLQKSHPHVLFLFTRPTQRLIHSYLIKQTGQNKMSSFIHDDLYLANIFARYMLDIAMGTRLALNDTQQQQQ